MLKKERVVDESSVRVFYTHSYLFPSERPISFSFLRLPVLYCDRLSISYYSKGGRGNQVKFFYWLFQKKH